MIIVEGSDPIGEVVIDETPVEVLVTFPGPQGASSGTQSDTTPQPVGATGSAGTLATVSRGDHVHALPEAIPADTIVFDQTPDVAGGVGILRWNAADGTVDLGLTGGNVTVSLGQEQVLRVVNKTGGALTRGQIVRIDGAQGNRPKVALATAANEAGSSKTIGMVAEPIADNQEGFITLAGIVDGLNTDSLTDGAALWLSTTAGQYTTTRPTSPNHGVHVGWCVRAHQTQGQILVHVQNGVELDELHNVLISNPTTGQVLRWNGTTWSNANFTTTDVAEGTNLYFTNARALSATAAAYDAAGAAAAAQSAAISAAAGALSTHESDTTNVHGITDTSALVVTSDARLTNSRTPTAHAVTHGAAGSDPVTLAQSQVTNLTTDLAGKVSTSDSRLTDARTPTAHKSTHAIGGTDALTPADIGAVASSEKGANSGVATLDGAGKIPSTQLPALAITTTYVVASQAAQLALTAQEGDVAVRTDLSKSFILRVEPASTLANWQELLTPTDSVASVDGRTGTVTLSDLYAPATGIAPTAITGTAVVTSDSRLSDARTPTAHKTSHATGGTDALAPADIGAVPTARTVTAGTGLTGGGDLSADRTLAVSYGTTVGTAAQGNDSRLSDSRTPTAHAASHGAAGSDALTLAQSQVTNLTTDLAGKVSTSDSRLTDARTPTAHKISHSTGGTDALAPADIGAVPTTRTVTAGTGLTGGGDLSANRTLTVSYGTTAGTAAQGNDSRLSDARTPTAHAATHGAAGSDPVTVAQSQVTNLTTDLAAKAPLATPSFTGNVTTTGTIAATGLAGSLLSSTSPVVNGTAAAGTSAIPARQDHVHPTDTTRAADSAVVHTTGTESIGGAKTFTTTPLTVSPGAEAGIVINGTSAGSQRLSYRMSGLASWDIGAIGGGSNPAFQILRYNPSTGAYVDTPLQIANSTGVISLTGTTVTNTPAVDNNSTQVATTAFVLGQAASATPANLGTAAAGTSTRYARADHVHARPQQVTRCTADTAAATTGTYVAPTGFTSPSLTSGRTYHYRLVGWYQAAATGTYAIQHRLQYPTLTAGSAQNMTFSGTSGGAAAGIGTVPVLTGTSAVMVSATATTANASIGFSIEGLIIPSANGTLTYDFTPSAAGTITIMGGTFLIVTEVA